MNMGSGRFREFHDDFNELPLSLCDDPTAQGQSLGSEVIKVVFETQRKEKSKFIGK